MKLTALAIFIVMYVLMIAFSDYRPWFALGAAGIYLLLGVLPPAAVLTAINWNVLLMMTGTMLIVYYFIESKMPNLLADFLLDLAPNVMWVTILMSLFSGFISAFIDNVATVLMVAPVGLAICKKQGISPVGMTLAIAVSSNLQGAATLVGDTTSIMLGAYAGMDFTSFFFLDGKPSIFWAVELGAIGTIPIMMYLFRKDRQPVSGGEKTAVDDYVPTAAMLSMIFSLILISFIPEKPETANGLCCMFFALLCILHDLFKTRKRIRLEKAVASVDYQTLLLLIGLFVVIEGITAVGIIDDLAGLIARSGGSSLFLLYTIIVWGSVLCSAFVDNIPYVATLLPVITQLTRTLGISPYLLYFGLLCGATLGGNLTPIGASANITAVGLLRKAGYKVSFRDFAVIGIPFTLTAVLIGYLFIWFVWS